MNVKTDPVMEAVARKLAGFDGAPWAEKQRMIERAVKAGCEAVHTAHVDSALDTLLGTCTWTEDEDGNWETTCGQMFCLIEGGPEENHYQFCPYCGKAIVECKCREENDEDGERERSERERSGIQEGPGGTAEKAQG